MSYVSISENGCWRWTGHLNAKGYGVIGVGCGTQLAHRASYEIFIGPIPKGLDADHQCHTVECEETGPNCLHRRCVNPNHILPMPHIDNCRRGNGVKALTLKKIAAQRKARTHCPYGHEFTPENTYINPPGGVHRIGRVCLQCVKDRSAIKKLLNPKTKKTHCKNGHEFTPENTFHRPPSGRGCLECNRIKSREFQRKLRVIKSKNQPST